MGKAKIKIAGWLRNVADRIEGRVVRCDIGTGKDYTAIIIDASISHEVREATKAAKGHSANDLCEALRKNGFIEYSEDEYNL